MRIHVADHPLIAHKLTTLRDRQTDSPTFRRLADELVTLSGRSASEVVTGIQARAEAFSGGEMRDDLTVLALRVLDPPSDS